MSVSAKCAANVRVGESIDIDSITYRVVDAKHNKVKGVAFMELERLSDGHTRWFGFPERDVIDVVASE